MRLIAPSIAATVLALGCPSNESLDDPDLASRCTVDADCDDGIFCNGVEVCAEEGCVAGSMPCTEGCDEAGDVCLGECADDDADGDGVRALACGGTDCDDENPDRFPGNSEVCDVTRLDEDCDPLTFGVRDADGDGFPDARCCNVDGASLRCGTDCDDSLPQVNPSGAELCDTLDNDCDGSVDEGCDCDTDESRACGEPDGEGGFLEVGQCREGVQGCSSGIFGECSGQAAQIESCNGLDDDCDGSSDEDFECVGDSTPSCTTACGTAGTEVCSTACELGECRAAAESCNYCDDDGVNEAFDELPFAGVDRDSFTTCGTYQEYTGGAGAFPFCDEGDMRIVSGTNDRAALWRTDAFTVPHETLEVDLLIDLSARPSTGGFAVVLSETDPGSTRLGSNGALGVPYGLTGYSIEWRYGSGLTLRRLTGAGSGVVEATDSIGWAIEAENRNLVRLVVRFQPENPLDGRPTSTLRALVPEATCDDARSCADPPFDRESDRAPRPPAVVSPPWQAGDQLWVAITGASGADGHSAFVRDGWSLIRQVSLCP